MNQRERFRRGEQNIGDAAFVREVIIPKALDAGRWNIVVFECTRPCDVLLKRASLFTPAA
jgi:hypothetical protein